MARSKGTPTVQSLVSAMEKLAPPSYAESWDNVGLIVGARQEALAGVLLCIDLTAAVIDEARQGGHSAVVAYHPPVFKGLERLAFGTPAVEAARAGLSVYSPHTALDVAQGGTNDVLADLLELEQRLPLRAFSPQDGELKLVSFVPEAALEAVSRALFAAGAGRIGNYSSCSFRSPGTGTFFGEAGASPTVGEAGRLETAAEVRLETVVPVGKVEAVVAALRQSHPYEEPAFDLVRLATPPLALGMGRVGRLDELPRRALVERVKERLGVAQLWAVGSLEGTARRVAVCAGAGGELLGDVLASGADVYVTGELRHHDALRAAARGLLVLCAGHSNSERPALAALRDRLSAALAGVRVELSRLDRDPIAVV